MDADIANFRLPIAKHWSHPLPRTVLTSLPLGSVKSADFSDLREKSKLPAAQKRSRDRCLQQPDDHKRDDRGNVEGADRRHITTQWTKQRLGGVDQESHRRISVAHRSPRKDYANEDQQAVEPKQAVKQVSHRGNDRVRGNADQNSCKRIRNAGNQLQDKPAEQDCQEDRYQRRVLWIYGHAGQGAAHWTDRRVSQPANRY